MLSGIVISVIRAQNEKVSSPIRVMPSGIAAEERDSQDAKAPFPMLTMLFLKTLKRARKSLSK